MSIPRLIIASLLLGCSSAAFAAMNADLFYAKAVALKKKGAGAMFSKDLKPVMAEAKSASAAVKAENDAAKKAGKPLYCPPKKASMGADEFLKEMEALGSAKRKSMTTKQAFRAILVKRYPCG